MSNTKSNCTLEYLQYHDQYSIYENAIVLMRVGEFWEMYATEQRGPDLLKISEITNLVRTQKNKNKEVSIKNPYMCGVIRTALEGRIEALINENYIVVLVDQITLPPKPQRGVTSVISPGTYTNIDAVYSNYIVCLYIEYEKQCNTNPLMCVGLSTIDVTTGICSVYETYSSAYDEKYALDEAHRFILNYDPKEVIIIGERDPTLLSYLDLEQKKIHYIPALDKTFAKITYQNEFFNKIYKNEGLISSIEELNMEKLNYARISLVVLFDFISKYNKTFINNINKPDIFESNKHLILGNNCINQLNITGDTTRKSKINCLLDVVNKAITRMGKRYLRYALINPLNDVAEINLRYDCTEELINLNIDLDRVLHAICDIQKLDRKIISASISPNDLYNLIESYTNVQELFILIATTKKTKQFLPAQIDQVNTFIICCQRIFNLEELKKYNYISDICASVFNVGVYTSIDSLVENVENDSSLIENVSNYLVSLIDLNSKKKTKTNVILKKNKKLGAYLVLSKAKGKILKDALLNINMLTISDTLTIEKSSLSFDDSITTKTKIYFKSDSINSKNNNTANNDLIVIIKHKYTEVLLEFSNTYSDMFKAINLFVSKIDFINSNAKVAVAYNYCKPTLIESDTGYFDAKQLRHGIVERLRTDVQYIAHDVCLGKRESGMILMGENSSGKSTLMKACALSIIMAQAGMFVPAREYTYSPYDHIFIRIVTNDDIYKSFSSFTYEMTELMSILKRSSAKTAIFADEICNTTETTSAVSLVGSTIMRLSHTRATFVMASHFHELAKIKRINELDHVKVYHLSTNRDKDTLIFNRLLLEGYGNQFYGLTIASHIIKDDEFMRMAYEIKDELCQSNDNILATKTSHFNSTVYVHECAICKARNPVCGESILDCHHIDFQCTFENNFKEGKTKSKNDNSNLIILCKPCHRQVHSGSITINDYVMTTNGRMIDYL